jgi:glycosyltransferase involved in cell wall biosynthesis
MPMYNVEKVVARSVQSLFSQTLKDFEVVFVDDCSSDNTGEELRRIISSYNREDISIKNVRHESNQGVAAARNTGLDNASGEYVYYLDADDYFDDDALSSMYETAKMKDADVVGCEWLLSFENNARHMVQPEVKTGMDAFVKMCNGVMRWNLWLFMVRRDLYEDNEFRFIPRANMGEDMMVMMKILLNAGSVSMVHRPLYHYIQTNSNAMTKNFAAYRGQVSENVAEVERYVEQIGKRKECQDLLNQLKLNLKLPLIISDKESDYKLWQDWFPESTAFAGQNPDQPFRTRLIQRFAAKKIYFALKLYYKLVIKFIYGVIYR